MRKKLPDCCLRLLLVLCSNTLMASLFLNWLSKNQNSQALVLLSWIGFALTIINTALVVYLIIIVTSPEFQFRVGLGEILIYFAIVAGTLAALKAAYDWTAPPTVIHAFRQRPE